MNVIYRPMIPSDIAQMDEGFIRQGWGSRREVLEKYYAEQQAGSRFVVFAEADGFAVGYATLLPSDSHGPFAGKPYPAVCDFNVLESHQRHGIGNEILNRMEEQAAKTSDIITLGVGLHPGYGPAQRMYVKRGYIPDGSGVWYENRNLGMNEPCVNDDDLVIYMSKKLDKRA